MKTSEAESRPSWSTSCFYLDSSFSWIRLVSAVLPAHFRSFTDKPASAVICVQREEEIGVCVKMLLSLTGAWEALQSEWDVDELEEGVNGCFSNLQQTL